MKQVRSHAASIVLFALVATTFVVATSLARPSSIGVGAAPLVDVPVPARSNTLDTQTGKVDDPKASLADEVTQIPFPYTSANQSAVSADQMSAATGPAGAIPEVEPNNTVAAAQPLTTTTIKVKGNIQPGTDVDFYVFTPTVGSRVYAAVQTALSSGGSGLTGDATLEIYASDGTTLLEADNDDGSFAATAPSIAGLAVASTAPHYIKVRHSSNAPASEIDPYDLYLHVQSGSPTAEVEPNNNGQTPNALPASGWVAGTIDPAGPPIDNDTYSLSLNAGDTVFLSLDANPERDGTTFNPRLAFGLFDNFFLLADGSAAVSPNSEAFFMTVKNAGTYVVYVDTAVAGAGPTATYHLSVSVYPQENARTCQTYMSTDVPKTIPVAAGSATSTLTVPDNVKIGNLKVHLNITHSALGELDVSLIAPDGNEVVLFDDPPAAAAGTTAPQIDVTLDDEAGLPMALFGVNKPIIYQPESLARLAWFKNQSAAGTWTLVVRDDSGVGSGTLNGWGITVCEDPSLPVCPAPATTVFSTDFESGAAGFTHTGTSDEWELGLPSFAPITSCHSGTNCWKTDLDNTYNNAPAGQRRDQTLVSPNIDLTSLTGATITIEWAMKYNLEGSNWENAYVEVIEVGGSGRTKRIWEWFGPTMTRTVGSPASTLNSAGGWGVWQALISEFGGSTVQLVFHLDQDDSVALTGIAVDDVKVTACPVNTPPENVTWIDPVQLSIANNGLVNNSITRNGNAAAWSAGATSNRAIASGFGYVQAEVGRLIDIAIFGLGNDNADQSGNDIEFGIYFFTSGGQNRAQAIEKNVPKGSFTTFTLADDFKVAVEDSGGTPVVKYYKNGVAFYTNTSPVLTYPLRLDTALNNAGSAILQAVISGANLTDVSPRSAVTLGTCTNIVWNTAPGYTTNVTAVDGPPSTIEKISGANNNWNAGTSSTQSFTSAQSPLFAEATVDLATDYFVFGLSAGDSDAGMADIDWGIFGYGANKTIKAVYQGQTAATIGTMAAGDVLRIQFNPMQVKFYSNNIPLLVGTYPVSNPFFPALLDTSLYNTGSKLNNVQLCNDPGGPGRPAEEKPAAIAEADAPQIFLGDKPRELIEVSFSDAQTGDYYYEAVQYLGSRGVVSGYGDGTFRPYAAVTRGQLAKIVVLAAGEQLRSPERASFGDVAHDNPFYQYIETALWLRVVSGYGDGTFKPFAPVTRGQLTKMVVLGMSIPLLGAQEAHFRDVAVDSTFFEYVETAYQHGMISGYADGSFKPGASATRGQVAKIIHGAATADLWR